MSQKELRRSGLAGEPHEQFRIWFDEARAAGQPEPDAMCLATATVTGLPSSRMVLLKAFDHRGFVFYSNERSRKGEEMAANPVAALTWRWSLLDRQVRATGEVGRVSEEECDVYFASRARGSQIGAWASPQSAVIGVAGVDGPTDARPRGDDAAGDDGRTVLDAAVAAAEARFAGMEVPRPPQWRGFRVTLGVVEFWQGRDERLHDRFRYQRRDDGWVIDRLFP